MGAGAEGRGQGVQGGRRHVRPQAGHPRDLNKNHPRNFHYNHSVTYISINP